MYVGLDQDSLFKAYKNAASGATATVREYSRKMKKNCFPDDSVYLVKSGDQLSIHEQSRVITYNYLNPHGKTTSFAAGGYDVIYPVLNCDHPISFQTSKNTYPYLSRGTAQFNEGVKTLKKAFPEFALKFEGKIEY